MDLTSSYVGRFFVDNFALLLISIVMVILAIQHFKQHRLVSIYTMLLLTSTLLLAVFSDVEIYAKENFVAGKEHLYYVALISSFICYLMRPACIYFMIMMSEKAFFKKTKTAFLLAIPLFINAIVFSCAFIPGTENLIYGFDSLPTPPGGLGFAGGPLRYTAHIVSALYLAFLLFIVIFDLKSKHISRSYMLLVCSLFVVLAVVIESFFNNSGNIQILNVTIAISASLYYLYLYMERNQRDGLTGLFNREAFYQDKAKMDARITGVIQFDMNGLKYINDNFGHSQGDKALKTIAETINSSVKSNMYSYRLGGDEFIVLVNGGTEEDIKETILAFKEKLSQTSYHCSIGASYRGNRAISLKESIKESEKEMYKDKEEFYKSADFERRKADQ